MGEAMRLGDILWMLLFALIAVNIVLAVYQIRLVRRWSALNVVLTNVCMQAFFLRHNVPIEQVLEIEGIRLRMMDGDR
jgi:glucan phosphoethanolaminetransferase (alkaline phosphatase superfamily)